MAFSIPEADLKTLRSAFRNRRLTLYLGAGVSVASGLPSWEKLVLSVYFAKVSERELGFWRPFPNYLYAISDWYLKQRREPLEVTARKVRRLYPQGPEGQELFQTAIRDALYRLESAFLGDSEPPEIGGNSTLQAVADLCNAKLSGSYGVRSVVTYNYDDLLERALQQRPRRAQPVFDDRPAGPGRLPVFHVHGYLPFPGGADGEPSQVVFSEEEYNEAASAPYSWSNLVQLREMSNAVGVMVGLSVDDRNIRRLLDALGRTPVRPAIYAVLRRPGPLAPDDDDVESIDAQARDMLREFAEAGIKSRAMSSAGVGYERMAVKAESRYQREIRGIVKAVDDLTLDQDTEVLQSLGITPIWYDDHAEIGAILRSLHNV